MNRLLIHIVNASALDGRFQPSGNVEYDETTREYA